jgi:hypothetical protein
MFWRIPPACWDEQTVAIACTGPSLTGQQLDACRASGFRVIVVHIASRLAPWADVMFAGDVHRSWAHYGAELMALPGLKVAVWGVNPTSIMQEQLHDRARPLPDESRMARTFVHAKVR